MIEFNIENLKIEYGAQISLSQYYNTNNINKENLDLYFKAIFLGIVKRMESIYSKALVSPVNNYSINLSIDTLQQTIRICWKENDDKSITITTIEGCNKL